MKLFALTTIVAIMPAALAADCYGDGSGPGNDRSAWDMRARICQGSGSFRRFVLNVVDGGTGEATPYKFEAWGPDGNLYHCWDAFANIIDQCGNGGHGGVWKLDGQTFVIDKDVQ